jgi:hypothetical protein
MQIQPVRVVANFEPALLDALDAFRRAQPVIPSRAETIRQAVRGLCEQVLPSGQRQTAAAATRARSRKSR